MKLTCSCGATIEVRDNFAGAVDARRWSEDHAICRARATELLQADLAAARAELDERNRWREQFDTAFVTTQADLAAARAEVERLRAGGCARDQRTTQWCAEAEALRQDLASARALLRAYPGATYANSDLIRWEQLRLAALAKGEK